jgi:excinuclease ABC subunit B
MDYLPKDTIVFLDESHVGVPQLIGMYRGDHSRKSTLVDYGFRLPSALDNRPLRFDEFNRIVNSLVYVSATPGDYELKQTGGRVVEQVVRPTGLLDPAVLSGPPQARLDDLYREIVSEVRRAAGCSSPRSPREAEELTSYYQGPGREGEVHALGHRHPGCASRPSRGCAKAPSTCWWASTCSARVWNPEVTLVAILDADKEGFLRSERSLIQTAGQGCPELGGPGHHVRGHEDRIHREGLHGNHAQEGRQEEYNKPTASRRRASRRTSGDILGSIYERDYPDISAQVKTSMGTSRSAK